MTMISRRALLAAGASLPLVRGSAFAQAPGKVLRFGLSSFPPSLQPWVHTGTAALTVKLLIFRGLTGFDENGEARPELAESWTQDGPTGWLFKLRQATFHNGKPVTAEDVKWTLEQVAAPNSTAFLKAEFGGVERIETPDQRTVRIVMKEPTATLPIWLASPHMPIIAKDSIEGRTGLGVGAGPFTLKDQERGVSIEVAKFDKYYKPGLPKLAGVKLVAYADENLRVAALQAGDIDLIEYVPWQHMGAIEKDPRLTLVAADGPFMGLNFNGGSGPFKDVRLRQAVAHAIRREEIVQAAFFGRGSKLESIPIPPSSPYFDKARSEFWSYNPDKAKKLLAEAGVPKGFSCTLLSTAQYGMHKSTAEVVQAHLGEIGIDVKLNLPDWAGRVDAAGKGRYEFLIQGTAADNNDPDGLAPLLDGELPANMARSWQMPTPEIHALFVKGRSEFDPAKRKVIYAELEKIAQQQAPLVGLAWRSQGYGMVKGVTGFKSLPGGTNFFSAYSMEETSLS
ncbi:ABC transporter substrate-binding protein [Bosea psychrotolerans]|uniref:Peptide/nickel transport system substrate-binding protein n=1 Tax=Bosea psychrotolerans TaxID=1871628 RepID=A0A2S4LVA5_9HYPH|nr:ABC transporter substrate-binding protein [Bosea psychrotolerans]POR46382.1 peptide/nickel transport system substrate-binding protein [Bosea psychrotolerans]